MKSRSSTQVDYKPAFEKVLLTLNHIGEGLGDPGQAHILLRAYTIRTRVWA